jgi:hypothetical protein
MGVKNVLYGGEQTGRIARSSSADRDNGRNQDGFGVHD